MSTYTQQQLEDVARRIAEALIEDALSFTIPVDAEEWSTLHDFVDANEYALNAVEELGLEPDVDDPYRIMNDAEQVAFAVFRVTPRLDALRALCKKGARVKIARGPNVSDEVYTVDSRVYRESRTDREMRVLVHVSPDDESGYASVKVANIELV